MVGKLTSIHRKNIHLVTHTSGSQFEVCKYNCSRITFIVSLEDPIAGTYLKANRDTHISHGFSVMLTMQSTYYFCETTLLHVCVDMIIYFWCKYVDSFFRSDVDVLASLLRLVRSFVRWFVTCKVNVLSFCSLALVLSSVSHCSCLQSIVTRDSDV